MQLSVLGNYRKTSNETMKNQGENKNRTSEFHEFIHGIADLIGFLIHFSFRNTYISDLKRECN